MSVERFNKFMQALGLSMSPYDFTNKDRNLSLHIQYKLGALSRMIDFEGLPETINKTQHNIRVMSRGYSAIIEHNGELYSLYGGRGGLLDANDLPTEYIVANPALKLNKTYKIGVDCCIVPNDSLYIGVLPILIKYGTALVENELSMNMVDIITRAQAIISAEDDTTAKSAEMFITDLTEGKISAIRSKAFIEGLNITPLSQGSTNNALLTLMQYNQYLKANELRELGVQEQFDMKREAINSNESQLNYDSLKQLIDDMKETAITAWDNVNKMFGINVKVKFGGVWAENEKEADIMLDNMETEQLPQEGGAENETESNEID